MIALFKWLVFVFEHPLNKGRFFKTLWRIIKWQISSSMLGCKVLWPWVGGTFLAVKKGDRGLTMNIYCGLSDFFEMTFLLKTLGEKDCFFDIGANCGAYSILACGVCKARGIAIEPVSSTFDSLRQNITLNNLQERCIPLNVAVGEKGGHAFMTKDLGPENRVLNGDFLLSGRQVEKVIVKTIDSLVDIYGCPTCIKIDTEGYELLALTGATRTLRNQTLKYILIEIIGHEATYGASKNTIVDFLGSYNFKFLDFDPIVFALPFYSLIIPSKNKLFIRD